MCTELKNLGKTFNKISKVTKNVSKVYVILKNSSKTCSCHSYKRYYLIEPLQRNFSTRDFSGLLFLRIRNSNKNFDKINIIILTTFYTIIPNIIKSFDILKRSLYDIYII